MANPSRDWRPDRSRDRQYGQLHRDRDDDSRDYRSDFERDDAQAYGRSAEGIGDYGGYGAGEHGAYSEEERSYRGDFSPRSGRRYGHPDRDERRDGVQERYGNPVRRDAYGSESRSGRDDHGRSSFAYGRNDYGSDWNRGRDPNRARYPHDAQYGQQPGQRRDYGYGDDPGRRWRSESSYGEDRGGTGQSHRGKGPKGYQRSDERLKEVICERLSDDPDIDASEITLAVSGGAVRLTGTVESRRDKFEVEELVAQCSGVKDVDNQLKVQSGLTAGRDLSLSSNGGYAAAGLDGASSSASRRPEAQSTTSGLSSPAKKQ